MIEPLTKQECRSLEKRLREQLLDDCAECKTIGYNPNIFQRMLAEHGPVEACQKVIMSFNIPDGFLKLLELKRLELTVEATVVRGPWRVLFERDVIERANRTLRKYNRPDLANP